MCQLFDAQMGNTTTNTLRVIFAKDGSFVKILSPRLEKMLFGLIMLA